MRAKVTIKQFELQRVESKRVVYTVFDTAELNRSINIVFDEDMWIDNDSDFKRRIDEILEDTIRQPIQDNTIAMLENRVNQLLNDMVMQGYLFTKSMSWVKDKKWILLYKDPMFDEYDKVS